VRDPACQLVFFAVLEGLYTDGVTNEVVDRILAVDPTTGQPRMEEHFVYACPLCHPAFEAFRLYRLRSPFSGLKAGGDTFGTGLDARVVSQLMSEKQADRLAAVQALIDTWVRRRIDSLRLTKEERADLSKRLEERRQEGMAQLKAGQSDRYAGWKGCAVCDGAAGACRLPR
jgi:hypothetical protein